jgi:hypothetical protein
VAPLKQLTIPKLELCAATLLAKPYKKAIRALNTTINESYLGTYTFCHCTDTDKGPSNKLKTFLGNRVAFIHKQLQIHGDMPNQSNPADLISRGAEPTALATSTLWWKGPQWLTQEPSSWPTTEFNTPTEILEIRNVHIAVHPSEDITQRYSKLNRLITYCILQKTQTADILNPTGKQPL